MEPSPASRFESREDRVGNLSSHQEQEKKISAGVLCLRWEVDHGCCVDHLSRHDLSGIGPALRLYAGSAHDVTITGGCTGQSACFALDASGNPISGVVSQNYAAGQDYFSTTNTNRALSDAHSANTSDDAPALRSFVLGNRFAGVGIDPVFGYMLNTGQAFGFGASIALVFTLRPSGAYRRHPYQQAQQRREQASIG